MPKARPPRGRMSMTKPGTDLVSDETEVVNNRLTESLPSQPTTDFDWLLFEHPIKMSCYGLKIVAKWKLGRRPDEPVRQLEILPDVISPWTLFY